MKRFSRIFFAVAALFAFACTTDTTEDLGVELKGQTTLTLSLEESRTQLGTAVAGLYPVTWSEGDVISVNGVESSAISISENKSVATFTFNEVLAYPYTIAYPAAAEGKVVFADQQTHTEGTFAEGAAAMYGYKTAEGGLALNHLTGVLKIGVTGDKTLSFAQISNADRAPIAGEFELDFATGEVTPTTASKELISYSFGDGLALTGDAQYIHATVPAGVYDELYVTLYDTEGGVMYTTIKADDTKPLNAGKVREFSNTIAYAPNAEAFVIRDVATLKAFGEQAATLEKNALVVADIDMTGEAWTPIEGYAKTLLGNGYAIKGLTAPLFGTTNASIKGLHLEDVAIITNDAPVMGALACTVTATDDVTPVIEHCSVSGTLTVNNQTFAPKGANSGNELVYAGLVARAIGVSVDHCVNNVAVTVDHLNVPGDTKNVYPFIGGVMSYAAEFTKTSGDKLFTNITNCTNSAAVTYQDQSLTELPKSRAVYIGGILVRCAEANHAIISNNTNDAPVTIQNAYIEHSNRPMVGGVVARTGHLAEFTGNKNTVNGTITVTGNIRKMYLGGVFGYMAAPVANFNEAPCTIADCANYADVKIECPDLVAVDVAGLGGDLIYFNMTNCHNYGKSVLVKNTEASTAGTHNIAGLIGVTTGDQATLRMKYYDCTNNAAVTTEWTSATVSVLRVAGITAYSHASWNNCHNKGAKVYVKGNITSTAANAYFQDRNSDTQVTIGGIGGYLASTGSYDCNNYADVEVDATWVTTNASFIQIGGLTGRTHNKIWRGVNYGNVYLKGDSSGVISGVVTTVKNIDGEVTCNGSIFIGGAAGITYYDCEDLHNEGNVYITGNHNFLNVGGVAGGSSAYSKNFTNKGTVNLDATYNKTLNVGGVVGNAYYNGQSDILDCHNYGKINVTGEQKAAVHVAGVACEVDGSHNKGVYNHEGGDIYVNMRSSTTTLHVGGCQYRSKDQLTDAVNEGNITVEGAVGGTLYIGGVLTIQNGYNRTNCTNKGKITVGATINGGSCFVGGICYDGQYDKTWKNCHNEGDIEFTKDFYNTGNVRCGGLVGKFETADQFNIFDGCSNSGNITFNGRTNSYIRFGGLIGCLNKKTTVIITNGFTNSGNISFDGEVTAKSNVHLGSIIGCCSGGLCAFTKDDNVWTGNVVNTGTISANGKTPNGEIRLGGFFGLFDNADGASPFMDTANYYQLGDVINTGDAGETGKLLAAGVVPVSNVPVSGVEVYCNVKIGAETNTVGMIFAQAPTTTVVAKNCNVGGTICKNIVSTSEDADGNAQTTIQESLTTLDATNWHTTLFGGDAAWGESSYEGCSFLAEKPVITPTTPEI